MLRGNLRRPWHDARAAFGARGAGYDAVYTRDPFSLVCALLTGEPVVFETYRFDLNRKARYGPWRRWCYARPNLLGIITHSRVAAASFRAVGVDADRLLIAHNGYAEETMQPRRTVDEARAAVGLPPNERLVVYTGSTAPTKAVDSVLPLARALPDVRFVIVGHEPEGRDGEWLPRLIRAANLENVTLIARVPPAAVADYLYAADCLLIPPSARPLRTHARTVLPFKTFQYLAAGRPILAPDLPDLREILQGGRNAVLVPPDEPDEAAAALGALLHDPTRCHRLARAAAADARSYTWHARGRTILDFLERRLTRYRAGR